MISTRGAARSALLVVLPCSLVVLLAAAAACSSNVETAGVIPEGDAATDAVAADSAPDAGPVCEGPCKVTALEAEFGGKKAALDRAQFGTQQGSAGPELHIEAHAGGSPACPVQQSVSPDRTLIVSAVPRGKGPSLSARDGLVGSFLDFKGDFALPPSTKALTLEVTNVVEDPATPPAWFAFDLTATFLEGSIKGHAYATHCTTMDE